MSTMRQGAMHGKILHYSYAITTEENITKDFYIDHLVSSVVDLHMGNC